MSEMRLDPILTKWLGDGPEVGPEHGLQRALAATRSVQQRPGWTFGSWWLPVRTVAFDRRIPRALALSLAVMTMIALLAALAMVAGTFPPANDSFDDENLIAYQEGPAIYVAQPDGSGRRSLTDGVPVARLPVFSPDGRHVAFIAPTSANARTGRLMIVALDGSNPPVEVSGAFMALSLDVPQLTWSPDGRYIAFAALNDNVPTIFVTRSDGSATPSPITDGSAARDLPTWSPDGDFIAFREKDPDASRTRLRLVRPDGTDLRDITTAFSADAYLSKLRWSAGASYWFDRGLGSETSASIDLGYGRVLQPWTGPPGGIADFGIPWSPDGTRIAILTQDEGVLIADSDPSEPYDGEVRTLGPVADCWVDWAPSGDALYGGSPDGCDGVVVIRLDDPAAAARLPGSTVGIASWQPRAGGGT